MKSGLFQWCSRSLFPPTPTLCCFSPQAKRFVALPSRTVWSCLGPPEEPGCWIINFMCQIRAKCLWASSPKWNNGRFKIFSKPVFIVGQITAEEEIFLHVRCLSVHFCEQLGMSTWAWGRAQGFCPMLEHPQRWDWCPANSPQILDSMKPITRSLVFIQSYWNYCVSESAVECEGFFPPKGSFI